MKSKEQTRKYISELFLIGDKTQTATHNTHIEANIMSLVEERDFRDICIYVSTKNEVETRSTIETLLQHGTHIYVPKVLSETEMKLVEIHHISELKTGSFGILEPVLDIYYDGEIDVFFVPGVAFTKDGKRLGRGKGYYDRFLSQEQYRNSLKVGVCYDFQIVDDIPVDEWDVGMDKMIFNHF